MKELKNINKEFIILIIIFGIICINALIIIIMCLVFESDGTVPSIIMGLEAIIIGLVVIIVDRRLTKKKYPDCFRDFLPAVHSEFPESRRRSPGLHPGTENQIWHYPDHC